MATIKTTHFRIVYFIAVLFTPAVTQRIPYSNKYQLTTVRRGVMIRQVHCFSAKSKISCAMLCDIAHECCSGFVYTDHNMCEMYMLEIESLVVEEFRRLRMWDSQYHKEPFKLYQRVKNPSKFARRHGGRGGSGHAPDIYNRDPGQDDDYLGAPNPDVRRFRKCLRRIGKTLENIDVATSPMPRGSSSPLPSTQGYGDNRNGDPGSGFGDGDNEDRNDGDGDDDGDHNDGDGDGDGAGYNESHHDGDGHGRGAGGNVGHHDGDGHGRGAGGNVGHHYGDGHGRGAGGNVGQHDGSGHGRGAGD